MTSPYVDSSGRSLTDYPRPSVAVDTALLTVLPESGHLSVLQVRRHRAPGWALPGTFLHEGERLIDAVQRSLRDKAGVAGTSPRQLQVFDDPRRDTRGWVLSVAHLDVVRPDQLAGRDPSRTRLAPVDRPGKLPYKHDEIIERAVSVLRRRYASEPDPDCLLAEPFTFLQLRQLHEVIAGRQLQPDTFRRRMRHQLTGTGMRATGVRGKPAELYLKQR
jgi:ADP-ribose pyrophosphatase YjhB (NUDIX family)